ncbi:MAG: hypothetical protein IKC34_04200 [Clostridia bacterium]|nr:hypothetical protein [Clostridia bacterium]
MKKICAVIIAVVMMQLLALSAFAGGAFVSSPSASDAPGFTQLPSESEDCTVKVTICAYGDRADLENKLLAAMMTDAYEKIADSEDLSALGEDVEKLASKLNVNSEILVASELFALYSTDCDGHAAHGDVRIAIEPTLLDNFAGLLKYNGVGWELVECEIDGEVLLFAFDEEAVYTVLLHDGTASEENALATVVSVIAGLFVIVIIILLIVFFIKKKKDGEDEVSEDSAL